MRFQDRIEFAQEAGQRKEWAGKVGGGMLSVDRKMPSSPAK